MLAHKNFIPLSMSVTDVLGEVSFVLTETLHDQKKNYSPNRSKIDAWPNGISGGLHLRIFSSHLLRILGGM